MTIIAQINYINGEPINIGDAVIGYAQEYEEVSRDYSGDVPVIEVDSSRPKPLKDVPLFKGRVVWSEDQMALLIQIEQMLTEWEIQPATVRMGDYIYEKLNTK